MKRLLIGSIALAASVFFAGAALGIDTRRANAEEGGGEFTCSGGSVPAGTYTSVEIKGACAIDSGNVTVRGGVNVEDGAALFAAFGGSDLTVGRNVKVDEGGVLVLGCEPEAFVCFNDPDQNVGTMSTHHSIGGNLIADDALAALVHNNAIGRNVSLHGGGGGVNCDPQTILQGAPAYATFEDNTIGGNASIMGWHSCWLGFIRNNVGGTVNYDRNVTFDPDANEVVTNTIGGRLNCFGNSPAPQIGDSGGSLNVVKHGAAGQCAPLVAP